MRPRRDIDPSGHKVPLSVHEMRDLHLLMPNWRVYYEDRLSRTPSDVVVTAEYGRPPQHSCAKCVGKGIREPDWVRYGFKWQEFHHMPVRGDRVRIRVFRRRYRCGRCKRAVWEPLSCFHVKHKATKQLVTYIEQASHTRAFTDIAQEVGISDRTVRRIYSEVKARTARRPAPRAPVWLGIDEIHLGGSTYCALSNLRQKQFLDLLPDTTDKTLKDYLLQLSQRARTRYVCTDFECSYWRVIRRVMPDAIIVIDKFHIMRQVNAVIYAALEPLKVRLSIKQFRKLGGELCKRERRWRKNMPAWIEQHFTQLPHLRPVWEAKEQFVAIWSARDAKEAHARYDAWRLSLSVEILPWFNPLVEGIEREGRKVFGYFVSPLVTNGFAEVMNRKIREVHRMGHGYTFGVLRTKVLSNAIPKEKVPQVFDRKQWKSWEEIQCELEALEAMEAFDSAQGAQAFAVRPEDAAWLQARRSSREDSLLFVPELAQTEISPEEYQALGEQSAQESWDQETVYEPSRNEVRFEDELPDLSKSKYNNARQCTKLLYYELYERHLKSRDTDDQQMIKSEGNSVGRLATRCWPKGVGVDALYWDKEKAISQTRQLMADPAITAIFEAAFGDEGLYARVDILERRPQGRWRLIEVKSVNALQKHHVTDVAFQAHVLAGAAVNLESCAVMHFNRDFVRPSGPYEIHELFSQTDVTERIRHSLATIPREVERFLQVRRLTEPPQVDPGLHCHKPNPCPYWSMCARQLPSRSVLELPNTKRIVERMLVQGVATMDEIPKEMVLTPLQRRIQAREEWVSPGLLAEVESPERPVRYLYLGTSFPGIPMFPQMRPRQYMILHWALHESHGQGHHAFQDAVCLDQTIPYEDFLNPLLNALGTQGPIYVYTPREKNSLLALWKAFPSLKGLLQPVYERTRVLSSIMKEHYYGPGIDKEFSLKSVSTALKVSVPNMECHLNDNLAVASFRMALLPDASAPDFGTIRNAMQTYARPRLLSLEAVHNELMLRARHPTCMDEDEAA